VKQHCDVLVVGGGPAGSSAARRAALGGARVLLVEQKSLPRPKLCGGWVSRHALSLLNFQLPRQIVEIDFCTASLRHGADGAEFTPSSPLGVFVDRSVFDHHLVERAIDAGVELVVAKANQLTEHDGGYRVDTTAGDFTADAVVVATGANAALTSTCRSADPESWSGVCLEQRIPADWASHLGVRPGGAQLVFGVIEFGYGWVLHHGEYLIIGIGGRRRGALDIRSEFDHFWSSLDLPDTLKSPKGHLIPLGGFRRRAANGRILCVGDAAGMVDAFSGEGIATAIHSGILAADSLLAAEDASAAVCYDQACRREILPELAMSLRAARIFHALPSALLRAFCLNRNLLAEYDLVMNRQSTYSRLLRRAAWRFITGAGGGEGGTVNTCDDTPDRATGRRAHAL